MTVIVHDDFATFWSCAEPLLRADPVRNNVALIIADGHLNGTRQAEFTVLATVHHDGEVTSAVLGTGGRPILVAALHQDDVAELAGHLATRRTVLGCFGTDLVAAQFATAWTRRTETQVAGRLDQLLYELHTLEPPHPVTGIPRPATQADEPQVRSMVDAFAVELTGHGGGVRLGAALAVAATGGLWLWCVDGEPVAQAMVYPPANGVARISFVYTYPHHRGRGYAAAVTAVAGAHARKSGAEHVVLHTDRGNPGPNRVYRRIGFRVSAQVTEYTFGPRR